MSAIKTEMNTERMIDKRQAKDILGLSLPTINRLVSQRKIPFYKLGLGEKSAVRFKPSDLRKWLEAFRVDAET